jgi:hypothetical protein
MSAWVEALPAADLVRLDGRARFGTWYRVDPLGHAGDWASAVERGDLLASCVASVHRDGFLREAAVQALVGVEGGLAARFLALRAVDHVEQVRRPALSALTGGPPDIVLEVLLRLRSRAHGPAALTSYVEELETSSGHAFARRLLSADDALVRRFAYELAMAQRLLGSSEIEARLAGETDQWSRRRVAEHWICLDPVAAKARLLHSRYVEGRLIVLEHCPDNLFSRSDLERRMVDRSRRVRETARWRYRRAGHEPAAFYRSRWEAGGSDVETILAGLRETGQTLSEDEARTALYSDAPRLRLAGLLGWPNERPPKELLLALLADPSRAVVKHAARILATIPSIRYQDVAAAAASELPDQRRAAWLMRRELGGWNRVRGDLEAMRGGGTELADTAEKDLLAWLERSAATTYQRPLPAEREAIRSMLDMADLRRDVVDRIAFHAGL